uniref:Uncharacterized LOC114458515 n=1 Tax=Gouania willdenowi TaxID=441366 RepID=A0A8C5NEI4_GOUWI
MIDAAGHCGYKSSSLTHLLVIFILLLIIIIIIMKLQLLLFSVLLRLSVSAPMGDNCDTLTQPLSLENTSVLEGGAHLLYGYTDNDVYKMFLNMTQSSAFNITVHNGNVTFHEENKINGSCIGMTVELEIKDNTVTMSANDVKSSLHLLPTCEGCYVFYGNSSAKNLDKLLSKMHLNVDHVGDVVNAHALYFFGRTRRQEHTTGT